MQTIKTGVVVALLLAVCYGAFVALNTPEPELPPELQQWVTENEGLEEGLDIEIPTGEQLVSMDAAQVGVSGLSGLEWVDGFGNQAANNLGANAAEIPLPDYDPSANSTAFGGASNATPTNSEIPSFPALPGFSEPTVDLGPSPGFSNSMPSNSVPQVPLLDGPAVGLTPTQTSNTQTSNTVSVPMHSVSSTSELLPGDGSWQLPQMNEHGTLPVESSPQSPALPFDLARKEALQRADNGRLAEALKQLSPYYNSPELTHAEHSDLVDILDALSRQVIYSHRHIKEPAYVAVANDTVESVANQYKISPELLRKINQLGSANALIAGTSLKVVTGPFRGQVSLTRGELTVFLDDLYAGRFPISVGNDPAPTEGTFEVIDRRRDRTYYGVGGLVVEAKDPSNPYGGYWLNLGKDLAIHGTPEKPSADLRNAGCISLAPLDASDVYDILTLGSQVSIGL